MPDLQQHAVTFAGTTTLTVPHFTVAARVTNSQTGALIADLTGANAIDFVVRVQGWTQAQHQALVQQLAPLILQIAAGTIPPLA